MLFLREGKTNLARPWVNPLNANPSKWPNTLKQFVGKLPKAKLKEILFTSYQKRKHKFSRILQLLSFSKNGLTLKCIMDTQVCRIYFIKQPLPISALMKKWLANLLEQQGCNIKRVYIFYFQ